jgi:hypothetical protein
MPGLCWVLCDGWKNNPGCFAVNLHFMSDHRAQHDSFARGIGIPKSPNLQYGRLQLQRGPMDWPPGNWSLSGFPMTKANTILEKHPISNTVTGIWLPGNRQLVRFHE